MLHHVIAPNGQGIASKPRVRLVDGKYLSIREVTSYTVQADAALRLQRWRTLVVETSHDVV